MSEMALHTGDNPERDLSAFTGTLAIPPLEIRLGPHFRRTGFCVQHILPDKVSVPGKHCSNGFVCTAPFPNRVVCRTNRVRKDLCAPTLFRTELCVEQTVSKRICGHTKTCPHRRDGNSILGPNNCVSIWVFDGVLSEHRPTDGMTELLFPFCFHTHGWLPDELFGRAPDVTEPPLVTFVGLG